jgi:choline dehydrogenase
MRPDWILFITGVARLGRRGSSSRRSDVDADVVVIGAGSAGCVLAARLSEQPDLQVLLLEAGPDYPEVNKLPAELRDGSRPAFTHDWGYRSEPGALGRTLDLNRARVVGGCSATNATVALRGHPGDYDGWAALGCHGWAFDEVVADFRRLEHDLDFPDDRWHGADGPLPVRRFRRDERTAVQRAFLDAASALGFPWVEDHNAPGAMGAGPLPVNSVNGVRQSAALTYLAAARHRRNLTVIADAEVDRLVLEHGTARGARLTDGRVVRAPLVVLSAGAYGSPAILLRSGVGPAPDLARLGIPCVADLPGVGRNLIDHPLAPVVCAARSSPPAGSAGFQVLLTARTSCWPGPSHDIHVLPMWTAPDGGAAPEFVVLAGLMKPRSRGSLRLRSADPAEPPQIDVAVLADADDMTRMVEAVRLARRLIRTPPLAELTDAELLPGPQVSDDEDAMADAIRASTATYYHPVGTCRMGPESDNQAVVDSRCRVHGVEGLRVIDASIMPDIPAANTNLPTLMLAEHAAASIRSAASSALDRSKPG